MASTINLTDLDNANLDTLEDIAPKLAAVAEYARRRRLAEIGALRGGAVAIEAAAAAGEFRRHGGRMDGGTYPGAVPDELTF